MSELPAEGMRNSVAQDHSNMDDENDKPHLSEDTSDSTAQDQSQVEDENDKLGLLEEANDAAVRDDLKIEDQKDELAPLEETSDATVQDDSKIEDDEGDADLLEETSNPTSQDDSKSEDEKNQLDISCPYVAGNKITLQLNTPVKVEAVQAEIVRIFEPFTLSCAMVVRVDCPELELSGSEEIVLKIFDRRFAKQAREGEKMQDWSLEIENTYQEFLRSELGSEFVLALPNETEEPSRDHAATLWNTSHEEAYLHYFLGELFESELRTYDTLEDLQGKDIPRLITAVQVPGSDSATLQEDFDGFSGILMQFIPGLPLTDLVNYAPKDLWQPICDDAIRIINLMGDKGILNEDVQTRSFIVEVTTESPKGYNITMIDFALCSCRDEYENDQDWSESKGIQEEEEAIGLLMESKLAGAFVYNRSFRYKKPASYYEGGEGFE